MGTAWGRAEAGHRKGKQDTPTARARVSGFGRTVTAESCHRKPRLATGQEREIVLSGHRGIHVQLPFGVPSRGGVVTHGAKGGWEVVPGCRRRCGLFHGEVAIGRGGEELATPHGGGRQE